MSGQRAFRTALPFLFALLAYALWATPLLYPLKIFVVFLHELSHGLAALLTGGEIVRIELAAAQGGVCVTRGGSRFLVLSAGYLGSLMIGAMLLVISSRKGGQRTTLAAVGVVTLAVTVAYVRTSFGFAYGLVAGAVLLLAARKLSEATCGLVVMMIGVTSCLYAVWDIASDTLLRQIPSSDATALGRLTGIPGPLWGVAWIIVALGVTLLALRRAAR